MVENRLLYYNKKQYYTNISKQNVIYIFWAGLSKQMKKKLFFIRTHLFKEKYQVFALNMYNKYAFFRNINVKNVAIQYLSKMSKHVFLY